MFPDHRDRCVGALLGTACGDILGAAVEGWSAEGIREAFGRVCDFRESARGFGCYTDDTQMTLALATSLVRRGRVDAQDVSQTYARFYEPWRGYGGGAHAVLRALQSGAAYRHTGRMVFPDGSYANGGAMRIAPVGLAYRHAEPDVLHRAVEDAIVCTHVHPEAIDGAFVQALAVAKLATTPDGGSLHAPDLLRDLRDRARSGMMQEKLSVVIEALGTDGSDDEVVGAVGNGLHASEAVACALWALARYGQDPEDALIRAVGFGGDTDTIAAMAGALLGALHGAAWIPARWYDNIENHAHGREAMIDLGRELAELDVA